MTDDALRDDIAKVDVMLDGVLDDWLKQDVDHMRLDGVAEDDIEAFVQRKRDRFEQVKVMSLAELVAFATGRPITRTTTLQ